MTKKTTTTTKRATTKTATNKVVAKKPVKEVAINPSLSLVQLTALVARVDSIQKSEIAEAWIKANTVCSATEKCELLALVHFKAAVMYSNLCKSIKLTDIHKISIEGVKTLKNVG